MPPLQGPGMSAILLQGKGPDGDWGGGAQMAFLAEEMQLKPLLPTRKFPWPSSSLAPLPTAAISSMAPLDLGHPASGI